jgi:hypothetical protein
MRTLQKFVSVLAGIIAAVSIVTPVHAEESIAIASRFAEVNGTGLRAASGIRPSRKAVTTRRQWRKT